MIEIHTLEISKLLYYQKKEIQTKAEVFLRGEQYIVQNIVRQRMDLSGTNKTALPPSHYKAQGPIEIYI